MEHLSRESRDLYPRAAEVKILFLNQTYYPDMAATAQHLRALATELSSRGHEVTVLCAREGYVTRGVVLPARQNIEGVQILRAGRFPAVVPRVFRALLLHLIFAIRLRSLPKSDLLVVLTSPPLVSWVAAIFGRYKQLVYWALDLNPDQVFRAGWVRESGFLGTLLKRAHRMVLRRAALVLTLDRFMAEQLKRSGADPATIRLLPVWAEDLRSVDRDTNPFRREHEFEERFVVMYSGNLSLCHPISTVLDAARELREEHAIVFVFIGGGARLTEVHQFAAAHRLSNIRTLPYQPLGRLSESLSAGDLHVVSMGDDYVGIVHPSKVYGIMAVHRPWVLIGPKESGIGDLIEPYGAAMQVAHGDTTGFLSVVQQIRRAAPPANAAFAAQFSRRAVTGRYVDLLESLGAAVSATVSGSAGRVRTQSESA